MSQNPTMIINIHLDDDHDEDDHQDDEDGDHHHDHRDHHHDHDLDEQMIVITNFIYQDIPV